jgi:hypothetical protein
MTAHQLATDVERFVSDNRHSNDLDDRWLADFLEQLAVPVIREIRNNNVGPKTREAIKRFRAKELEAELERDRDRMKKTERELEKLRA